MGRTLAFNHSSARDKALVLFWRKGYQATTLDDLLQAMEISRSSFYASFTDKRSLFLDCLDLFAQRLAHFGPLLQVQHKRLALSSAGTRWGSARADGAIRLNWRLIHLNPTVIDYVVAHELSHLRVMNHSPHFWDTVRSVLPNYAALRGQLKDELVPKLD